MQEGNNIQEDAKKFFDNYYSETESNQTENDLDNKSKQEANSLFNGGFDDIDVFIKHEEFRLKKINSDSERKLREGHAGKVFWFSLTWVSFIVIFILLYGFKLFTRFNLTETEFIFVCGTLTTSIFAFYLIVIKNLFPNRKE